MNIEVEFEFGQTVYLKTDADQKARMVTGIVVRPTGFLVTTACGTSESNNYAIEISKEKSEAPGAGFKK